ncbi:hypothetical protein SASPL_127881 [Salvia splendens]|uniref:ABC transporter domain-containing protein n=2 Tax=Salvia splendens TaxID=180675 RepID=A0A8X8XC02_SALSN|nr:hypothetical protein SASPL_127881 [Salvia splendens]
MGIKLILSAVLLCGTLMLLASAEPVKDKSALLDFIRYMNYSRSLNWDGRTSACTSWIGITCNHDSSRVIAVKLPSVGFKDRVPTNTLGRLSALQILSLRSNGISGPFPSDILKLRNLSSLYLESNDFEGGPLPLDLSLDLANNSLSGDVPDLNIQTLQVLDLSNNNLTGNVGTHLNSAESAILAIVIGSSAAAVVALALLLVVTNRWKKGSESGASQKTEKSARGMREVLGKGTFGTTYKAALEDATTVAVKRLKEVIVGRKDFEQQMEVVGNIRHPNVIASINDAKIKKRRKPVSTRLGNKYGCVSDLGLATLMNPASAPMVRSGYRDPEVMDSRKALQASDVYGYGVFLLELLTGKSPVHTSGGEEWTGEVFHVELLRYPNLEEEMLSMLQIGLSCVATRNSSHGGTRLALLSAAAAAPSPLTRCAARLLCSAAECPIVEMGKKKSDESAAGTKSKQGAKEKFSVTELLASMDAKPDKPKKASASTSKPKPKAAPKTSSYIDGIDLPSSDEEEDVLGSDEEAHLNEVNSRRNIAKPIDTGLTDKELKKRGKKDVLVAQAAEVAKKEALKDDRDAFTVVIGSRASVLDGENDADANVKDITVENFSVAARGKELLKNTSVKISHGKRYGLVGPNGMGKSTLLKLLAWRKIPVPKNIDVLLVEQEVVGDDRTALEAVVSANEELVKLRQEVASLQDASTMSTGDGDEEDDDEGNDVAEKLTELYEKLQLMGSDAAEAQASKILAGLGFTKDMQGRATRSFSGGWRMRISLARALFVQPTLLLLDEPTNHLDLRAVLWLEEYLCRWKKTLIVVSHDRDFLNTVCNEIIHLHDLKLHLYRGNFDDFEGGYEQRRKEANKKSEAYEKQLRNAKRSGSRTQQEKVKDRAKFNAAKEASKSKSKGKVDEDEPVPEAPRKWKDYTVEFHFPEPTELTPPLMQLLEVSFSYPNREDFRLSNVDVGIDMGTRVAIVGPNGAGKSTLLNLLAGDLVPTEGEVRRSQKLRIGRYSQHFVDLLTMDETPVQYLLRLHPEQEGLSKQEAVRAKLGKFGLPSHNHLTPIAKLSGGQKARVVFTSISMSKPHILLLDEPTNHLDMQSIDALADALDEFTGGVVLVSHDSRLISRVCQDEEKSQIWVVENGTVEAFPDSFEDYKDELVKEIRAEVDD